MVAARNLEREAGLCVLDRRLAIGRRDERKCGFSRRTPPVLGSPVAQIKRRGWREVTRPFPAAPGNSFCWRKVGTRARERTAEAERPTTRKMLDVVWVAVRRANRVMMPASKGIWSEEREAVALLHLLHRSDDGRYRASCRRGNHRRQPSDELRQGVRSPSRHATVGAAMWGNVVGVTTRLIGAWSS